MQTPNAPPESPAKYINLTAEDRFVSTAALRAAYICYDGSRAPDKPAFVSLADGYELGIVSSEPPDIARAVSSLLSRSLEDAKDENGGHLPRAVVERVQLEIISPFGVAKLWGTNGHRFVLSQPIDDARSELVATILVARRKGTVFFFTGRYNNVRHSTMDREVDFDQPADGDPQHKWFSQFAFPEVRAFKPVAYHQIANFVVAKEHRGKRLSRFLLDAIQNKYANDTMEARGLAIEHCQHLLCGRGFWQVGDPPWLPRMEKLGFYLRWGAESFFIEQDWAPLPPVFAHGEPISNLEYNRSFGLPQRYRNAEPPNDSTVHLPQRIAEVTRLSQDPRAKLQYFQTLFDFV